jgi:hypothetical protein
MTVQELLQQIADLSQRIEKLEARDQPEEETAVINSRNKLKRDARQCALFEIVKQLALHEGISIDQFEAYFEEQYRFHHERLLRIAEKTDQNGAGEMDDGDPSSEAGTEPPPPLFPA